MAKVKFITLPPLKKAKKRAKKAQPATKKSSKKAVKRVTASKTAPSLKRASSLAVSPRASFGRGTVAASGGGGLVVGALAMGGLFLLARKSSAKAKEDKPATLPLPPVELKPEPSKPEAPKVSLATSKKDGKTIKTVGSIAGWKRASAVSNDAVIAANEAITDAEGKDSSSLIGQVYTLVPGKYLVVYEQHYWPSKGVHLGASVFVPK